MTWYPTSAPRSRPTSPAAVPPPDPLVDYFSRPSSASPPTDAQATTAYHQAHGVLPPPHLSAFPPGTTPQAAAYAQAHGVFPTSGPSTPSTPGVPGAGASGQSASAAAATAANRARMGSAASSLNRATLQRAADSFPSLPSLPASAAMSRSHSTMSSSGSPAVSYAGQPGANPLEILLDSDHLVLRGQGGDMAPAYLSGYVSLWLAESTNIKDITMNLSAKAKVHFSDSSR